MSTGAGADRLVVTSAGAIRARTAIELPMTTGGFLDVIEGGKDRWLFNFDEHTGRVNELAEFDTTCAPHPTFVGHGEFVAFGCRGSADKQELAGFNLKGEEMWQQSFSDTHTSPAFSFAPAAGRFALGRVVVTVAVDESAPLPEGAVSAEEVRVVQSYDGQCCSRLTARRWSGQGRTSRCRRMGCDWPWCARRWCTMRRRRTTTSTRSARPRWRCMRCRRLRRRTRPR